MKRLSFAVLSLISSPGFSQSGIDHINPVDLDLVSTQTHGRVQVFSDFPELSTMVIDDFYAEIGEVDGASFALELLNQDIGHPDGWRVSFWASAADAANSGDDFTGNTLATKYVDFAETNDWTLNPVFGAGSNTQAYVLELKNLGLSIGTGVRFIGIAPVQGSTVTPVWYILGHKNPGLLGNGTANDSIGINPGNGLGFGKQYAVGTNAAYQVTLVPEPLSIIVLCTGLAAALKRRRS